MFAGTDNSTSVPFRPYLVTNIKQQQCIHGEVPKSLTCQLAWKPCALECGLHEVYYEPKLIDGD